MSQFPPLIPFAPQSLHGAEAVPAPTAPGAKELFFLQELNLRLPALEAFQATRRAAATQDPGRLSLRWIRPADGGNNLPDPEQVLPPGWLLAVVAAGELSPAQQAAGSGARIPATDHWSAVARHAGPVGGAEADGLPAAPGHAAEARQLPKDLLAREVSARLPPPDSATAASHESSSARPPAPAAGAQAAHDAVLLLTQSAVLPDRSGPQQPAMVQIGPPLQHPDWGGAVAARVVWQIGEQLQQAQFRIHPPDLGPVEVRIAVNHDQANVQFIAQHALVRDALEDSIPRLREMLSGQGLTLADAGVSERGAGDPRSGAALPERALAEGQRPAADDRPAASGEPAWLLVPSGRLDIYV